MARWQVMRFEGEGDIRDAAREALRDVSWLNADELWYDEAREHLIVRRAGRNTVYSEAKNALEAAGIVTGRFWEGLRFRPP